MKIAYFASSRLPSCKANSVQVLRMCEAMAMAGHEVRLFARAGAPAMNPEEIFRYYGVEPVFSLRLITAPSAWFIGGMLYGSLAAAAMFRDKWQPDIIYGRNLYALLAASACGSDLYYESHAAPANLGRRLLERILFALPAFKQLIVINQKLREFYLEGFPGLRQSEKAVIVVAHDGATEPEKVISSLEPGTRPDKKPVIGYAGGLYPGKGIEIIVQLAQRLPDCLFRIAGGSEAEVNRWRSYCRADNLEFIGHLPHAAVREFLAGCDLLVAPYRTRVSSDPSGAGDIAAWMSPLKIFEYMAVRRPIVATQLPAVEEILTDGRNALLVEPDDIAAWVKAITALLSDRESAARLSQQAQNDFTTSYTWKARVSRIFTSINRFDGPVYQSGCFFSSDSLRSQASEKAIPTSPRALPLQNTFIGNNNGPVCRSESESVSRNRSRRIRCLHVIGDLSPGGSEKMLCRLLLNSDQNGFEHQVVTLLAPGALANDLEKAGIRVFSLHMPRKLVAATAFQAIPRLARLISLLKPDLIHAWMYNADILTPPAAWLAGKIPVITSIRHGLSLADGFRIRAMATMAGLSSRFNAARVVACSATAAQYHGRLWRDDQISIIPNGFVLPEAIADRSGAENLARMLGIAGNFPLIGVVGRFAPEKDHQTLVKAAAIVGREFPAARFVLCGAGTEAENTELSAIIAAAGVDASFIRLGQRSDLPIIMRGLRFLVSASRAEAFPNGIGEAMAAGVPVVATTAGDSPLIVGDCGLLVPVGDPQKLAAAIIEMLQYDSARLQMLGLKARRRIATLFSIDGVVKQYEKLYLEVANEH
ncbi:MAG TPA: glycosyltransferase [Candidatus Rifleibacterium sp.]|nr:glycosyltransferase [Candidatus Rifleibacterium sp.]